MKLKKINFKKPNIKKLSKLGYTCIDMHVHSKYSDGFNKIKTILKKAKKKKIGIAITDHNGIKGAVEASKQKEVLVIPGIEVNSKEGPDILVYFYDIKYLRDYYKKYIKKYVNEEYPYGRTKKKMIDIIKDAKRYKSLVSVAHPYGFVWKNFFKYLKKNYSRDIINNIDALEIISGELTRLRNLKTMEMNNKLKKMITGGSDAHIVSEIGRVVTCCKANDVASFLNKIKRKKNIIIGKEIQARKRLWSHSSSLRKKIKYVKPKVKDAIRWSLGR